MLILDRVCSECKWLSAVFIITQLHAALPGSNEHRRIQSCDGFIFHRGMTWLKDHHDGLWTAVFVWLLCDSLALVSPARLWSGVSVPGVCLWITDVKQDWRKAASQPPLTHTHRATSVELCNSCLHIDIWIFFALVSVSWNNYSLIFPFDVSCFFPRGKLLLDGCSFIQF